MAIVKFCIISLIAFCSTANAKCELPPAYTADFGDKTSFEVIPQANRIIFFSGNHRTLGTTNIDGKTHLTLTGKPARFCIYKREQIDEQKRRTSQYIFILRNSNRVIAIENDDVVVEELANLKKSQYIFTGSLVIVSLKQNDEKLRRFSAHNYTRGWEIQNNNLVHSPKSSDLCNRLFKLDYMPW